jgi:hypothetical protein
VVRVELAQEPQLREIVVVASEASHAFEVHLVSDEHHVVPIEVLTLELPRRVLERDAPASRFLDRAAIDGVAEFLRARTGGVDGDSITETGFVDQRAHDAFGGRRPADVAPADEADA